MGKLKIYVKNMLIYTKNIVVWKKMDYSPHILNRKGENYYFFYAQSGRIARSRYYCGFGEATYKAGE